MVEALGMRRRPSSSERRIGCKRRGYELAHGSSTRPLMTGAIPACDLSGAKRENELKKMVCGVEEGGMGGGYSELQLKES